VVAAKVPGRFAFAYRTERGAWSEARGCEVTRQEFCAFLPSWLLEEASLAWDAPPDANGVVLRPALLRAVKAELEVLWTDLVEGLPPMPEADLGSETMAARRFLEALVRLWHAPQTFEFTRTAEGGKASSVASAATLVSRVRLQRREQAGARWPARQRWIHIHQAYSAWWRLHVVADEEVVLLAMRWELAGQIRQALPGVSDQRSLVILGSRFGAFEEVQGVPGVSSGGQQRLAILARDLTEQLLEEPADWEAALPGADSQ
jgi:hypothetical protein